MKWVRVDEVTVPVDDEGTVQWNLRYGTPEAREGQRMEAASVMAAYAHLASPGITQAVAIETLKRVRKAARSSPIKDGE